MGPTLQSVDHWTQSMHSFLACCLVKDPKQRSSAADLLKHPFIKNAGKKSVIQQLVINVMPQIEKYRNEKRKKDEIEAVEKEKKNQKRKRRNGLYLMLSLFQMMRCLPAIHLRNS